MGFLDNKLIVTAMCNTQEGDVIMPSISALQYISQSLSGAPDEEVPVGNVYTDPEGRFSMPLIGEWTSVETDGTYAKYAFSDMDLAMSFVVVESDDLEVAVDQGLRRIGIDPAVLTETNRGPWDKWDLIYYSHGDGRGVTILWQANEGTSYLMIGTGEETLTATPPEDVLKTIQGFSLSGEVSLPTTVEAFEAYMNGFVGKRPPGLSMAIAVGEDLVYAQGFGLADGPEGIVATPETGYHWGSVTKTVTATAIMQLREQNLVDLDALVSDYLDYFPAQYGITVRHMLTHSTGLPEPADFLLKHLRYEGELLLDFDSMDREYYEGVTGLMFEPGSQSVYVNPDYVTLGQIVAAVSGQPYIEYVRKHILEPLGMHGTDFNYSSESMLAHAAAPATSLAEGEALIPLLDEARGLGDGADFIRETDENFTWLNHYIVGESAGGGLMGPATDMIRFGQMILNNGKLAGVRILTAESVALLQEVQYSTSGEPLGIGLTWHHGDDVEHPYIEHDGGGSGIQAKLRLYMKDGFAIAMLANGSGFDRNEVADAAANVVFSMLAGQ
jgi:CubicO group peptidase (beta-lactamase class C family)